MGRGRQRGCTCTPRVLLSYPVPISSDSRRAACTVSPRTQGGVRVSSWETTGEASGAACSGSPSGTLESGLAWGRSLGASDSDPWGRAVQGCRCKQLANAAPAQCLLVSAGTDGRTRGRDWNGGGQATMPDSRGRRGRWKMSRDDGNVRTMYAAEDAVSATHQAPRTASVRRGPARPSTRIVRGGDRWAVAIPHVRLPLARSVPLGHTRQACMVPPVLHSFFFNLPMVD